MKKADVDVMATGHSSSLGGISNMGKAQCVYLTSPMTLGTVDMLSFCEEADAL